MSARNLALKPRPGPSAAEWDDVEARITVSRVRWSDGDKLVASVGLEAVAFAECEGGNWNLYRAETEGEPDATTTREDMARGWLENVARDVADDWRNLSERSAA